MVNKETKLAYQLCEHSVEYPSGISIHRNDIQRSQMDAGLNVYTRIAVARRTPVSHLHKNRHDSNSVRHKRGTPRGNLG